MFCVYRHLRKTDKKPFYVGKGLENRPFNFSHRNKYHKRIVEKYGVIIEIVKSDLTEAEAFELEIKLIKLYKQYNMCEANLTAGGEGTSGYKFTDTQRYNISKATKGKRSGANNPMFGTLGGMFGKSQSDHQKSAVSSWVKSQKENHPQFKGYWLTPKGKFCSASLASEANGIYKKKLIYWCKTNKNGFGFEKTK